MADLIKKIGVRVVVEDLKLIPIIESRALESSVGDLKACGANNMQRRARHGAGARDIARVLRYLGSVEDDIELFDNITSNLNVPILIIIHLTREKINI